MAFFKESKGTGNRRLKRIETLVWVCIYGGLLTAVLGLFLEHTQGQDAAGLYVSGALAVAVGVVFLWVRSRIHDDGGL